MLAGKGTGLITIEMNNDHGLKEFGRRVSTPAVIIRQLLLSRAGMWWVVPLSRMGSMVHLASVASGVPSPQGHRQDPIGGTLLNG